MLLQLLRSFKGVAKCCKIAFVNLKIEWDISRYLSIETKENNEKPTRLLISDRN